MPQQIPSVAAVNALLPSLDIDTWMDSVCPEQDCPNLAVLTERTEMRSSIIGAVAETVKDHLIGLDIIERMGGYPKALSIIKNKIPSSKRIRSGDLGEILATEYIMQKTGFTVALKRLRYKDDRDLSMRGDDIIGFKRDRRRTQVLKAEAKSRVSLSRSVVEEAHHALLKHSSRPNPSTLAFISTVLRRENKDELAEIIEELQGRDAIQANISHLIFTLSGNDPGTILKEFAAVNDLLVSRNIVGMVITDHQEFIRHIFESIDGSTEPTG